MLGMATFEENFKTEDELLGVIQEKAEKGVRLTFKLYDIIIKFNEEVMRVDNNWKI